MDRKYTSSAEINNRIKSIIQSLRDEEVRAENGLMLNYEKKYFLQYRKRAMEEIERLNEELERVKAEEKEIQKKMMEKLEEDLQKKRMEKLEEELERARKQAEKGEEELQNKEKPNKLVPIR